MSTGTRSAYNGGMNLYGFADGNPVNESDPSGDAPEPPKNAENGKLTLNSDYVQSAEDDIAEALERRAEEAKETWPRFGLFARRGQSNPISLYRVTGGLRISAFEAANGRIDPNIIDFTHDSISYYYKGIPKSIDDTANELRSGTLDPAKVPIKIFNFNGRVFSLDNRRLMSFKLSGIHPYFIEVDYNSPAVQKELFGGRNPKFTAVQGVPIYIRNKPR